MSLTANMSTATANMSFGHTATANMSSDGGKPLNSLMCYDSIFKRWTDLDLWAPYRGKYPDPVGHEYGFICNFLRPFPFEEDDFVEDENYISSEKICGIANLRQTLIELVHQIRESKGYDVKHYVSFFSPFVPAKSANKETVDEAMEAVRVAMISINAQTIERGKVYELIGVEHFVWASRNRSYLLTLNVEEFDGEKDVVMADAVNDAAMANAAGDGRTALKIIRALVFAPMEGCKLKQWYFKT